MPANMRRMEDEKQLNAAKGGRARAKLMSAAERSESARVAAEARWGSAVPRALCGSADHPLRIGDVEMPCYVLEDGRRVLSQSGLQTGIGLSRGGGSGGARRLAQFAAYLEGKGIDTNGLAVRCASPIEFIGPRGGSRILGYEATILHDLCDAILRARKEEKLLPQQIHLADQAEILVRAFARVGIIALVDEATGYQDLRARDALAKILEEFISEELRKWVSTFPPEFYKQMFRLRGWAYDDTSVKRPQMVGKLTDNVVYQRLAPGVREELRKVNPRDEKGRRKHKHHQWLSQDVGHPKLIEHLGSVTTLMKLSKDWTEFEVLLNRIHRRYDEGPWLPMDGL